MRRARTAKAASTPNEHSAAPDQRQEIDILIAVPSWLLQLPLGDQGLCRIESACKFMQRYLEILKGVSKYWLSNVQHWIFHSRERKQLLSSYYASMTTLIPFLVFWTLKIEISWIMSSFKIPHIGLKTLFRGHSRKCLLVISSQKNHFSL